MDADEQHTTDAPAEEAARAARASDAVQADLCAYEPSARVRNRATLAGVGAIVLWSLMVGFLRIVTGTFGPELGAALVYTLGAGLLFVVNRPTPLSQIPWRYLLVGGTFFVAYETIYALAIGFAATGAQAIEVNMVNYLWPTLTVLFWAATHTRRSRLSIIWIVPGAVAATLGIALSVGGDELMRSGTLFAGVLTNPLPYVLAAIAAVLWGLYNTVAPALSQGSNATAYFFSGIAVALWVVFFAQGAPAPAAAPSVGDMLVLVATAAAVASGYALWNIGAVSGDMQKLSVASYFTPVLSGMASSLMLAVMPGPLFWTGTALVVIGSIASWLGSKRLR